MQKPNENHISNNNKRRNHVGENCIFTHSKGITIIALIITIIVMIILVGVTVTVSINGGLFDSAKEARFKEELSVFNEEYIAYIATEKTMDINFDEEKLNIARESYKYDGEEIEGKTINTAIPSISEKYAEKLEVIKGELLFSSTDIKELKWAEDIGIAINPYVIDENGGLKSNDSNLYLVDETGTLIIPSTVKGITVTKINNGTFAKVAGIKRVIIPGTVKEIGSTAFMGCPDLEVVIMEDGVEKIGWQAFKSCTKLVDIQMPDTVTSIVSEAFASTAISEIRLSNGLTSISGSIFNGCTNLTSLTIPEGVTTLENNSIYNCQNLKSVHLPASLTKIGTNFLMLCPKVSEVTFAEGNESFSSENGIIYNKEKTEMIYIAPSVVEGKTTFTVPSTVTTLNSKLLNSYPQITNVIINGNVTSIDNNFFSKNITNVTINNNEKYRASNGAIYDNSGTLIHYFANETSFTVEEGTTNIISYAFRYSTNLTSVTLPESLTTLDAHVFNGATNLKSITLNSALSSISGLSFYGSGITEINTANNKNYTFENGALYNADKTLLIVVLGQPTEFTIPDGVVEIGRYAFHYRKNLTKVTIPDSVEKIGGSFMYCTSLKEIFIPNSVTSIAEGCFSNSALTRIEIDNTEGAIKGAPWGCTIGDRGIFWLR